MNEEREQNIFGQYGELQDDNIMNQFEDEPYVTSLPQETVKAKKNTKEKLSTLILFILAIFVIGWCLISGMKGLWFAHKHSMNEVFTNAVSGDVYEGEIAIVSKEYCEYSHTINFVPAGTEHFYLLYSPQMDKVISLRAPSSFDETFDNDFWNKVSYQGRGIVRKLPYDVSRELYDISGFFKDQGIQVESGLYIDTMVDKMCYMQIFVGLSLIACCVYYYLYVKQKGREVKSVAFSKPILSGMLILFFVADLMLLYLLNMVGF